MPYERAEIIQVKANNTFSYCLSALKAIGADVEGSDINLGYIKASRGTSQLVFGHGVNFEMSIMPQGEGKTKVSVICAWKFALDRDPSGARKKIVGDFFKALDFIVQRAHSD